MENKNCIHCGIPLSTITRSVTDEERADDIAHSRMNGQSLTVRNQKQLVSKRSVGDNNTTLYSCENPDCPGESPERTFTVPFNPE